MGVKEEVGVKTTVMVYAIAEVEVGTGVAVTAEVMAGVPVGVEVSVKVLVKTKV
jgi:hypothetical protein